MSTEDTALRWIRLSTGDVDLVRMNFTSPAGVVGLSATEVDILRYFAARSGRVVTREDLLKEVWGYRANVVTRAVDHAIKRLRRKVESKPSAPVHILTVHGVGYRFEAGDIRPPAPEAPNPPTLDVRLGAILGAGGSGVVYRAEVKGSDGLIRDLAVKRLNSEVAAHPEAIARLRDEARLLSKLHHHHIVQFHGMVEIDSQAAIMMERVDGVDLSRLIEDSPPPLRVVLEITSAVADALHVAYTTTDAQTQRSLEIVHRDVKPGNILLSRHGGLKVTDFGVAQAYLQLESGSRQALGTPRYISPELWRSERAGPAADIYALGVTMLSLLGVRLERTSGAARAHHDHVDETLTALPARLPAGRKHAVLTLLGRMLAYAPADRPAAAEVRDRLSVLADGLSGDRLGSWARQHVPIAMGLRPRQGDGAADGSHRTPRSSSASVHSFTQRGLGIPADAFVGREALLQTLLEWPHQEQHVLTLLGPGGVGKTRLAQQLGRTWMQEKQLAAWFVNLREVQTIEGIAQAIEALLPLDSPPCLDDEGRHRALIEQLRELGEGILILDNVEQIVEAIAELLREACEHAPGVRWVLTSQKRLGVPGERVVTVAPLEESSAVTLLCARAGWDFQSMENAQQRQLRTLAKRLDGLPLAIELAASRATLFSPGQLLERLEDRFTLLRRRKQPQGSPHHQSLETALEWSWDLLAPWHRAALCQCTTFRGGFSLDAAEQIIDLSEWSETPEVSWVLQELVEASFLVVTDVGGSRRLGLLESIHAFSDRKFDALAREQSQQKHAAYFASEGLTRRTGLAEDSEGRGLAWMSQERGNLTVAFERALESKRQQAVDLVRVLCSLIHLQGPFENGVQHADQVLKRLDLEEPDRRIVLHLKATALWMSGRAPEARDLMERELTCLSPRDPVTEKAKILNTLGVAEGLSGDLDAAALSFEEAAQIFSRAGDNTRTAIAENHLGMTLQARGRLEDALAAYQRSLDIYRDTMAMTDSGLALGNIAGLYHDIGRLGKADEAYRDALAIHRKLKHQRYEVLVLSGLASLELQKDQDEAALALLGEGLEIARRIGDAPLEGTILIQFAELALRAGDERETGENLERAKALNSEPQTQGAHRIISARLARTQGDLNRAEVWLARAEPLLEPYPIMQILLIVERGWVSHARGDQAAAGAAVRSARELAASCGVGESGRFSADLRALEAALD